MTRSLAAVLAADVVGYSAMMGADEAAALAALRRLRAEVFGPAVAARRGRVVKSMGDGWIVLFPSAADAAACALSVQDRLAEGPRDGEPPVRLRIGLHIGDVTEEEEDVFGDGVNLAARLEAFAEPGAVAISGAVHDALDGRLRPSFDPAGERRFKNIDRPVRVWTRGGPAPAADAETAPAAPPASDRLRMAIRPVAVADDRAEIREIAEALTGDMEIYIDAVHWLSAQVSSATDGAAYALEPRLRARGDRLRLEVRLTDAAGAALWSGKFDGSLDDAFDWQDETGGAVADEALACIAEAERRRLLSLPYDTLSAAECDRLAAVGLNLLDGETVGAALRHRTRAIALDPRMIDPLALLLTGYTSAVAIGLDDAVAPFNAQFPEWLALAQTRREASPMLDLSVAMAEYRQGGDRPRLRAALERSLRAAPFSGPIMCWSSFGYLWMGEPDAALEILPAALRLCRRFGLLWRAPTVGGLGLACVMAGRDEEALHWCEEGVRMTATYATLHRARAAACAHLGRMEEARAAVAETLRLVPNDSIATGRARSNYADTPATRRYFDGLRLAGMPEDPRGAPAD